MCYQLTVPTPKRDGKEAVSNSLASPAGLRFAHRGFRLPACRSREFRSARKARPGPLATSAGAEGSEGSSPVTAGSLSRSSSTMRSAVFLPIPGMRTRLATSPRRMAWMRIHGPARPERIVNGQLGTDSAHPDQLLEEQPLVLRQEIRKSESASSRTCVWIRRRTSAPLPGGRCVNVETGMVTS